MHSFTFISSRMQENVEAKDICNAAKMCAHTTNHPYLTLTSLDGDQLFPNWKSITEHMEAYAKFHNFRVTAQPKDYFDFEGKRLPYKGFFYCSPLSENRVEGMPCTFHVNFLWNKKVQHYGITPKETHHSHDLESRIVIVDGRFKIKYQRDLTKPESIVIEQLSTCKLTVPMICQHGENLSRKEL